MLLSGDFEFGSCCAGKEHGLWGDFVSVGGHQVGKTAKNGLSNATSSISLSLSGVTANHNHADSGHGHNFFGVTDAQGVSNIPNRYAGAGGAGAVNTLIQGGFANIGNQSTDHSHNLNSGSAVAQTITGDNETRPVNRGVKYIIKV